jgi:hypothetical protein
MVLEHHLVLSAHLAGAAALFNMASHCCVRFTSLCIVLYRFRIMFLLHDTVVKVQDSSCASWRERADQLLGVRWRQKELYKKVTAVAVVNTQEGISFMSISSYKYPQHVSSMQSRLSSNMNMK